MKPIPNSPDYYDEIPDEFLDDLAPPTPDHEPRLDGPEELLDLIPVDQVSKPASFSDAHVAEAFADTLRGSWLYVAAWKSWLYWDGTRWARDETEQALEAARQFTIELVNTVDRIDDSGDKVKRAASFRSLPRMKAILELARSIEGVAAAPEEFDRNPDLLTVENGTLNLRTGDLRPHDPEDRITKRANAHYDPHARHEDVDRLLEVIDEPVRRYLQVVLGYAVTGHTNEALVLVFDGGGSNGKSLLLEALGTTLGDHAGPVSPRLVMRGSHQEHPAILAALQGLRIASIVETEEGGALRLEQVKAITGGDRITARYMYGSPFTFEPTHQLIIATNHRPLVNSTEHAAWRRLRLIRFPYTYKPEADADLDAGDRIADPWLLHRIRESTSARAALLAWLAEGARRWHRDGIPSCPEVEEETQRWRMEEDTLARFIDDYLVIDPAASVAGTDLYDAYRTWCEEEGRPPKSRKNFSAELRDHPDARGIEWTKGRDGVRYRGARLR